jgi:L-2-hydroxyglutarate oxidase LhgO
MDRIACVVIGAGVVGLAVARALARDGHEVLVLERERAIGTGTSSRNSEVIHAGIYYTPGSLKARLCVAGRRLLYAYCAERGVAHRKLGKFIVGTQPAHALRLDALLANARANDVEGIDWIDVALASAAEPALRCTSALHSRETGIVDSHGLMQALQGDLESAGGLVALDAPLQSAASDGNGHGWVLRTGGAAPFTLGCDWLINCAGLHAQQVAAVIEPLDARHVPPLRLARGCYFTLAGRAPFSRLIYPVPADGGLGVHLTLDLAGQARFGPDVEWIDRIDYQVDPRRANVFYDEIRAYWPACPDHALQPAYAGIRPKLSGPGEPACDFVIDDDRTHGVPRLINLFGIESPGLTAALAIGDEVAARARLLQ